MTLVELQTTRYRDGRDRDTEILVERSESAVESVRSVNGVLVVLRTERQARCEDLLT